MTRRECVLAALATAAGFLGGALSSGAVSIFAQERTWPKVITAEKFVVLDSSGGKRAELGVSRNGKTALRLYDEHGRLVWNVPDGLVWPATP